MCSIFKYRSCVGRNFDYEQSFKETFKVVPEHEFDNTYSVMGMVTGLVDEYPLFYDAMNEYGLCMGGLAFSGNAKYNKVHSGMINVPSYDFIFQILGKFKTVDEVVKEIDVVNITDNQYSDEIPSSDMHWFLADEEESVIIEQTNDGLNYYYGSVMTNNPPFPIQQINFNNDWHFIGKDGFVEKWLGDEWNSRGTETLGLIGDYTSYGRYSRLAYLKERMDVSDNMINDVKSSFHLLSSVEQLYGITHVDDKFEYTIYSIVYDMMNKKAYLKYYDTLSVQSYHIGFDYL